MAFKAITAITVLYFLASCAAQQSCSAVQCKLVPVGKDVASKFQSKKTSKKTIRMIYLMLKIGNDSFYPPETDVWVWAANIDQLMLSLSYDCNIYSLGLLNRQVGRMEVLLEDEPKGCLASLDPSCQNVVVAQALLGNVTTTNVSGGLHCSEDVVCFSKIDDSFNFYENFLEDDIEYRCCKVVRQGNHNLIPECESKVHKNVWLKTYYVVLNILTIFVGMNSPALLLLLPDFILDVQKEFKKERAIEKKEEELEEQQRRARRNGYEWLPSSDETTAKVVISENGSENIRLTTAGQLHPDDRESTDELKINESEPSTSEPNKNDSKANSEPEMHTIQIETIVETQPDMPSTSRSNEDGQVPEESNATEPNPQPQPDDTTSTVDEDNEEKRKADEIPVDDASPFNISTALYACKSAKLFRDYSSKLSFNIKLALLWYCLMPIFFYLKEALIYTLKYKFVDEIKNEDVAFLVGGAFQILGMTDKDNWIMFIVSYVVIPLIVITMLRAKDLTETLTITINYPDKYPESFCLPVSYIGNHVLQKLKINRKIVELIPSFAKAPVIVYGKVQNVFNEWVRVRGKTRLLWVLLTLIFSVFAVISSVMTAVICLASFPVLLTLSLCSNSPYIATLLFLWRNLIKRKIKLMLAFVVFVIITITTLAVDSGMFVINPFFYMMLTVTYPFFLALYSCRFVAKLFGYTIMGLILNADIAAPIVTFVGFVTKNLRDRYLNSQKKYQKIKGIISEEWQRQVEGLNPSEKPKVRKDTIPKQLFLFICEDFEVLPLLDELFLMLGEMAIIFLPAFLALCAVFFATDSYQIAPVASTIAVFVCVKMPVLLLRDVNNFSGWEKIETRRKIKEGVKRYIYKVKAIARRRQVDVPIAQCN